jgi:hypothetical protein
MDFEQLKRKAAEAHAHQKRLLETANSMATMHAEQEMNDMLGDGFGGGDFDPFLGSDLGEGFDHFSEEGGDSFICDDIAATLMEVLPVVPVVTNVPNVVNVEYAVAVAKKDSNKKSKIVPVPTPVPTPVAVQQPQPQEEEFCPEEEEKLRQQLQTLQLRRKEDELDARQQNLQKGVVQRDQKLNYIMKHCQLLPIQKDLECAIKDIKANKSRLLPKQIALEMIAFLNTNAILMDHANTSHQIYHASYKHYNIVVIGEHHVISLQ